MKQYSTKKAEVQGGTVVRPTNPVGADSIRPHLRSGEERRIAVSAQDNRHLRRQIAAPTREKKFGAVDTDTRKGRPYRCGA